MYYFKKSQRLLNKADYDHVFEQAKKIVNSNFIILYRANDIGHARLGLALSKKKIARSHDRNRVKRQLREAFRHASLPAVDLIFLAKEGLSTVENEKIATNLGKVWPRLTLC